MVFLEHCRGVLAFEMSSHITLRSILDRIFQPCRPSSADAQLINGLSADEGLHS